MQRQTAVTAYCSSEQLLLLVVETVDPALNQRYSSFCSLPFTLVFSYSTKVLVPRMKPTSNVNCVLLKYLILASVYDKVLERSMFYIIINIPNFSYCRLGPKGFELPPFSSDETILR